MSPVSADSTGVDEDHPFGDSWRYRDYVVAAFNEDLPYDQFVREQIAGDLLPAADGGSINRRGIIATGFLALGPMALAQRDPIQKKYDVVDEQIDTTSKAFLGLTIACARLPRPQVRSDPDLGLLCLGRHLREHENLRLLEQERFPVLQVPTGRARGLRDLHQAGRSSGRTGIPVESRTQSRGSAVYPRRGPGQLIAASMLASAGLGPSDGLESATIEWFREYLAPRESTKAHLAPWHAAGSNKGAIAAAYQNEFLEALREAVEQTDSWFEQALEAIEAGNRDPRLFQSTAGLAVSIGHLRDRRVTAVRPGSRQAHRQLRLPRPRANRRPEGADRERRGSHADEALDGKRCYRGRPCPPEDLQERPAQESRDRGSQALPAGLGRYRPTGGRNRQRAPGTGGVARVRRESSDRPGHGQPHLAVALRRGSRPDAKQLRNAGRAADPSIATGLARTAIHRQWLVRQELAPADHELGHIPDEQFDLRRRESHRSRKPPLVPVRAAATDDRGTAGQLSPDQRAPRSYCRGATPTWARERSRSSTATTAASTRTIPCAAASTCP